MSLNEKFEVFLINHPDCWELFQKFTLELIERGHKHGSADAVLHRIRWNYLTSAHGQNAPALNNDHTPFLARKFHEEYPAHSDFFFTRKSAADQRKLERYVEQELIEA